MKCVWIACQLGWLALGASASDAPGADAETSGAQAQAAFTIRADWFDRGNVRVSTPGESYADKYPCIWNAGKLPNQSEYDIEFPVTADYTFVALYTAHSSRPVDIYLDGQKIHQGFAGVTGSWQTSHAKWEAQCTMHVTEGKHTIKLLCPGPCMPHICAFRLESPVPFPEDWRLCRQIAEEKVDETATESSEGYVCGYPREPPPVYDYHQPFERVPPPTPRAHRILEYLLLGEGKYQVEAEVVETGGQPEGPAANNELLQERDSGMAQTPWVTRLSVKINDQRTETDTLNLSPGHLEKMLRHVVELVDDFRTMHQARPDHLQPERAKASAMLDEVKQLLDEPDTKSKWERFYRTYVDAYRLKNHVALENPLIDFDKLLLAKRLCYNTSHIYTTYYDGSHRYKPGSGVFVLSPVRPDGHAANLTGELATDAIYRDPDLSFDARRVLFSYKPDLGTPCRIYEVGIDGTELRQLTKSEYDDVDPCYLPDGRVMFVSTRCRRVTLCHNAFTVSVLHTMNADGSDIRCISPNPIHDFKPSVMPNGQITFTRWEYVDKHLGNQQSLWVGNPDGTRMTHIAGNHFGPLTWWEPFRVPDSRYYVCVLAPHMPIFENITPELPPPTHFSWLRKDVGYYTYAYPLSEKYFIVSYCYGPDDRDPTGYAIYLLDRWNNRDLIYRDPELGCFEPLPVRARPVPPLVAPRGPDSGDETQPQPTEQEGQTGTFYVADVYQGLPGIERGEVKYLRVIEEIPKPVSADCPGFAIQYPVISNRGHLAAKRLWGTVPVEPDGSAHFTAPANKALYFSALDERFMEIQRMRSFTMVRPGERFGCVGCHEPKHTAPVNLSATALRRPPSQITPPPEGGVHAPDFHYDVQPVLDRHCTECHSGAKPKGGIDLSPDYTTLFNVAYETLTGKELVKYVSDYSCASLPTRGPNRVHMPPEDFRRLVTWIDCNAPYYGTYTFTRPGTVGGRDLFATHKGALEEVYTRRCQSCHEGGHEAILCRIRLPEVEKTRALVAPLAEAAGGEESCRPVVFSDRSDPDFQKLVAIFNQVKSLSAANPRADMLGERPPLLDPECRYVFRP